MQIRELSIPDSYEITPIQRADDRGVFLEWYRFDRLSEVIGHPIVLRQGQHLGLQEGVRARHPLPPTSRSARPST